MLFRTCPSLSKFGKLREKRLKQFLFSLQIQRCGRKNPADPVARQWAHLDTVTVSQAGASGSPIPAARPASRAQPASQTIFAGRAKSPKKGLTRNSSYVRLLFAGAKRGRRSDLAAVQAGRAGVIFDIGKTGARRAAFGARGKGQGTRCWVG